MPDVPGRPYTEPPDYLAIRVQGVLAEAYIILEEPPLAEVQAIDLLH